MRVISVNLAQRERLTGPDFDRHTGIFKRPVDHPVIVGPLGLMDDAVVDTRHHGGPDQAVYLYRCEDYDWWARQLGNPLEPGAFGENLTLEGFPTPAPVIGSRLVFDELVLEITAPRIPCRTLATRMGDPRFLKRFVKAERSGFYCRVITPGRIAAGAAFTVAESSHPGALVTTNDLLRASHRRLRAAELERFLSAPIDARTRAAFERQLESRRAAR